MKKKMNKWVAVLLAVAVAISLAGCGVDITSVGLPPEVVIEKGQSQLLAIEYGAPDNASAEAIEKAAQKLELVWTSEDESIVTVDETGNITAIAAGETDVVATINGANISSACHVIVTVAPTGVAAEQDLALVINGTDSANVNAKVTPTDATDVVLKYTSSDEAVATVDATGLVTGVGDGSCTITSAIESTDLKVITNVTVTTSPESISAKNISVNVGKTAQVNVTTTPEAVSEKVDYSYKAADEKIATVSDDGVVTGVAAGKTKVTVTSSNGKSADIDVTVTKPSAQKPAGSTGGTGGSAGTPDPTTPTVPTPTAQPDPAPTTPPASGGDIDKSPGSDWGNEIVPGDGSGDPNDPGNYIPD